jgi:hypothetical protein
MIADVIRPGKGTLRELGVTKVYDFRSDTEIKKYDTPLPQIEGVDVIHIPVFQTADYSPEMMAKCVRAGHSLRFHPLAYTLLSGDINCMLAARQRYGSCGINAPHLSHTDPQAFIELYSQIMDHGGHSFGAILRHVRDRPSEGSLFHCTAGKDRTGIMAAILLKVCGSLFPLSVDH